MNEAELGKKFIKKKNKTINSKLGSLGLKQLSESTGENGQSCPHTLLPMPGGAHRHATVHLMKPQGDQQA